MEYYRDENLQITIADGILYVTHFAESLTLDIVKLGIEQRLKISRNISYPMLADIRSIRSTPKEVRTFLSRPENTVLLTAGAMLVKNVFQETIGNIFIFFDKPHVPARLFTKEADAIKWLESFK